MDKNIKIRERPILFNGEMVRAILDGRKTQTRKEITQRRGWPIDFIGGQGDQDDPSCYGFESCDMEFWTLTGANGTKLIPCSFGKVGDVLWVREAFRLSTSNDCACYEPCKCKSGLPIYRADFDNGEEKWKTPLHMPKWACRLKLEIKNIRVERLHDLSEDDAEKEGVTPTFLDPFTDSFSHYPYYYYGFAKLWKEINGNKSWELNPWVWVIEFKRIDL